MKVISSVISAIILVAIIYASFAGARSVQQTMPVQITKGLSDIQPAKNVSPNTYNSKRR